MFTKEFPPSPIARFITPIILIASAILLSGCFGMTTYPTPIPCGDTEMLVKAIEIANGTPTTLDTIELDAGCIYKLEQIYDHGNLTGSTGLPQITSPIKILGHGAAIIRSADTSTPKFRLFLVGNNGDLTLEELTLQNGYADDPMYPTDVQRNSGGAIRNTNELALKWVTIQNNFANGVTGGIFNEGNLEMKASSISGCEQDVNSFTMGGAVAIHNYFNGASAIIVQSAIYGNGLNGNWNAITNSETSTMTIENTTISGNGSRALNNDGDLDLIFSTIVGHGEGIWSVWYGIPTVDMIGTIFQNTHDCSIDASVLHINMNNMDSDGTCGVTYTVPPPAQGLLPLAHNGGTTLTHALHPASPAIDAVMGVASRVCPVPEDQRGVSRPQITRCDIGAFEFDGEILSQQPGVTPQSPPPPPEPGTPDTPTPTTEPNRCDLFDSENAALIMHDIPAGSTTLELFVEYPYTLPGLEEDIPGDTRPWEYSAILGDVPADKCSYRDYTGRIYCTFVLTQKHFGYAFPLKVFVNLCENPIFYHQSVSVFEPEEPTPTETPTEVPAACTPSLTEDACVAAGGTYDPRKKTCNCP